MLKRSDFGLARILLFLILSFSVACSDSDKTQRGRQGESRLTPVSDSSAGSEGSSSASDGTSSEAGSPAVANPDQSKSVNKTKKSKRKKSKAKAKPKKPEQVPFSDFPGTLKMELITNNKTAFIEPIYVSMENGMFSKHKYTLEDTFLGEEDNFSIFQGDNVEWDTPWEDEISIDLKNMLVLASNGDYIGEILHDGHKASLRLLIAHEIDIDDQVIYISPDAVPPVKPFVCPSAVVLTKTCGVYEPVYTALASIDYAAFGKVGPDVVKDVMGVKSILGLVDNVLGFEPDVDSIRSDYLIPLLKMVKKLKNLSELDQSNEEQYLLQTRKTYVYLTKTSIGTVAKTQKIIPDALPGLAQTGLGSLISFLGSDSLGDKVIARKQPAWFKQIVAPVIREVGVLSIDLLLNGSETPLQDRINRFLTMEDQVVRAVTRLCKSAKGSAKNECKEALR